MKFFNCHKALNNKKGEIRTIIVLIGMAVIGLGILLSSQVRDGRINLLPRAAGGTTLKIMSYNVLGEPLCRPRDHKADIDKIANFIKQNGIAVAGLQEVTRMDIPDCNTFDMVDMLKERFSSPYNFVDTRYFGSNDRVGYRAFVYTGSLVSQNALASSPTNGKGAESWVVNTALGQIRFIHIHPGPGQEALNYDKTLIPYVEQFKSDGIPIIIMGDTNLRYNLANSEPILRRIEAAGFYRACDPRLFPTGNCEDTVAGEGNFAIDHIYIDNRSRTKFVVKNAYVEQSLRFSDHLPVIVELTTDLASANVIQPAQQTTTNINPPIQVNLWDSLKPAPGNIYPWSKLTSTSLEGPTTGWESYISNYVYICNGKYCWILDRNKSEWLNSGNPITLDTDPAYSGANGVKVSPAGTLPWSGNGPTAAWTWIVPVNGQTVNETLLCNGNYCWRYMRTPSGTGSGWRDGGSPIHLPTYNDFWKDSRVAPLWSGNGVTVAWTDPINSRVTLCNKSDCRSLDYKNWHWRFNGESLLPYQSGGINEYHAAWTSPVTNIISLCNKNVCWQYDINQKKYGTSPVTIISTKTSPSTPTPTKPKATPTPFCTDSDGGKNYFLLGTTTGWKTDGTTNAGNDMCNGAQLQERFCSNNATTYEFVTCPGGCSSGKCNPVPTKTNTPIPTKTPTRAPTSTPTKTSTPTVTKVPTAIFTKAPIATATKIPIPTIFCARKSQGDANCDGIVNLIDVVCWLEQARGRKPVNCFSTQNTQGADFNGNGIVGPAKPGVHDGDLLDLGLWRNTYIKENTQRTNPPTSDNPTNGGGISR